MNTTISERPSSDYSASTKHGIVLILASVMPAMAIITLVPVLPLLMKEFSSVQGSQFLVPMALTLPALCVALFSPLAGWLSDRIGRKGLLVGALLVYAGLGVTPFFLTDLTHIIATRIGLGLAEAIIMTIATTLIGDYYEGARREKWIGIQVAVVSLSAIVLIAISGGLGEAIGSRGPFLLYLIAIPIAFFASIILFEPATTQKTNEQKGLLPLGKIIPLLLITLAVGIFFYTIIVKLGPILALSGQVSPGLIGAVGAAINIGMAVGTAIFQKFKHSSGPRLLSGGLFLLALGYVGMGLSGSVVITTVFAVIASLGAGLLLPTMLTWIMQILPNNVRGRGTGMWTGMFFLGQFVAPIVATAMTPAAQGLNNVLLIYAGVCLVGAIIAAARSRGVKGLTS